MGRRKQKVIVLHDSTEAHVTEIELQEEGMTETARVRALVERIKGEATRQGISTKHAAHYVRLTEEKNPPSDQEWAAVLATLPRALSVVDEGGTAIGVRDLREGGGATTGKPAPRYLGEVPDDSTGPYDQVAGTRPGFIGAGSSEPTNLGTTGAAYGSEQAERLIGARMMELQSTGRPADRQTVLRDLVNAGKLRSGYNPQQQAEQALIDALPDQYRQGA
jgi:hypothetical protein